MARSATQSATITKFLREIGRRGGLSSRRKLSRSSSRLMVQRREAKRALHKYKALCFWSVDIDAACKNLDVSWVIASLRRHGDRRAWILADKLEGYSKCP